MCVSLNEETSKKWTVQEADVVEFLVGIGAGVLGYGLRNGTLGVYQNSARLWRVKSKHALHSLVALDPYSDGQLRLVSGWSNGKVGLHAYLAFSSGFHQVEIRKALTGEMLFRESCSASVVAVFEADLRNSGTTDVVVCNAQGGVRGFHPVASLSESIQARHNLESKENAFARLNQRAKAHPSNLTLPLSNLVLQELRFELETLDAIYHDSLRKCNKESARGCELVQKDDVVCTLRADSRLGCLIMKVEGRNKNCRFKVGRTVCSSLMMGVIFPRALLHWARIYSRVSPALWCIPLRSINLNSDSLRRRTLLRRCCFMCSSNISQTRLSRPWKFIRRCPSSRCMPTFRILLVTTIPHIPLKAKK